MGDCLVSSFSSQSKRGQLVLCSNYRDESCGASRSELTIPGIVLLVKPIYLHLRIPTILQLIMHIDSESELINVLASCNREL